LVRPPRVERAAFGFGGNSTRVYSDLQGIDARSERRTQRIRILRAHLSVEFASSRFCFRAAPPACNRICRAAHSDLDGNTRSFRLLANRIWRAKGCGAFGSGGHPPRISLVFSIRICRARIGSPGQSVRIWRALNSDLGGSPFGSAGHVGSEKIYDVESLSAKRLV
jgi:hypothetical protein